MRYYTLRKAEKSFPQAPFFDIATVDVFLHGNTAGSLWASSLQPGDIIRSSNDIHEKISHLGDGQALLVGDETALPTVIAIIEGWQHTNPPIVISITTDEADQAYLPDHILPEGSIIHRISGQANPVQPMINFLQSIPKIDAD